MKRYLLCVLSAFLLEALLLSLLQDRPMLHGYMPKQDQALTYAFGLAWPLGLILLLFRRKKQPAPAKSKHTSRKPAAKGKKKSGASRAVKSS